MAQGPSDTILVVIRITLRIRESKVRNPYPLDYSKNCKRILKENSIAMNNDNWYNVIDTSFTNCVMPCSAEVCALWVLLVVDKILLIAASCHYGHMCNLHDNFFNSIHHCVIVIKCDIATNFRYWDEYLPCFKSVSGVNYDAFCWMQAWRHGHWSAILSPVGRRWSHLCLHEWTRGVTTNLCCLKLTIKGCYYLNC